jgi:ribosomal protein S18 acetylase RimI-like enzyme
MENEFQIAFVDDPEQSAWGVIGRGVSRYNKAQAGENNFRRICFVLQTPGDEVVGGVLGEVYWGWFHLDLLWVKNELRGRGFGHRLLVQAEDEASKSGAKYVYLDTFSFQAPDFYKRHGYQVFGELPDFPKGHRRYFLMKQLQG